MSLYDYQTSRRLAEDDPPFAALIMAALRKADTENATKLRGQWPEICAELQARYDAPGGQLPVEMRDGRPGSHPCVRRNCLDAKRVGAGDPGASPTNLDATTGSDRARERGAMSTHDL